ncbi:MAG: FumA C-terminus/TtdB family hydratase beta subunit [Oscillospiraceae bacterium]
MATREINSNNLKETARTLNTYDRILLTGTIYTARDAAHDRIVSLINEGKPLPFELDGATIYYAGPTKAPENMPIGSCGPTTSSRMDIFTPTLLNGGLSCMIGKGERNNAVIDAIIKNKAVYLCAIGGAGALACKCIKSCEVIAFDELGCESVKRLYVERFPLIVAIDSKGNNIFNRL